MAQLNNSTRFAAKLFIIALASLMLMSACTRIESGQVGVQRDFSGEYSKEAYLLAFMQHYWTQSIHSLFVKLPLV